MEDISNKASQDASAFTDAADAPPSFTNPGQKGKRLQVLWENENKNNVVELVWLDCVVYSVVRAPNKNRRTLNLNVTWDAMKDFKWQSTRKVFPFDPNNWNTDHGVGS